MWSRRDVANALIAAVIFTAIGLLLFPPPAKPATRHDAELVAWYLKGEGDAVFGARGWTISKLSCTAASGGYVDCRMRLDNRASSSLCATGRFRIVHFAVVGQFRKARLCSPSS